MPQEHVHLDLPEDEERYKAVLGSDTPLILSSESELFRFLDRAPDEAGE